MKLLFVRKTDDGIPWIGCRAVGFHKGYRIEKTAWQPERNFDKNSLHYLRTLATGQYENEVRIINNLPQDENIHIAPDHGERKGGS